MVVVHRVSVLTIYIIKKNIYLEEKKTIVSIVTKFVFYVVAHFAK